MRNEEMIEQLERLASLAAEHYLLTRACYNGRARKVFADAVHGMPEEASRLLKALAEKLSPGQTLFRNGIVSCFLTDQAYALLADKAISAYWFWRVVLEAAQFSSQLPLDGNDILQGGVAAVRKQIALEARALFWNVDPFVPITAAINPADLLKILEQGWVYVDVRTEGACEGCSCSQCARTMRRIVKNPLLMSWEELFWPNLQTGLLLEFLSEDFAKFVQQP